MGQAKRKGTLEQRILQAKQKEQLRLSEIKALKALRERQEIQAYETMVWWQLELSEEWYLRRLKSEHRFRAAAALWLGGLYPVVYDYFPPPRLRKVKH